MSDREAAKWQMAFYIMAAICVGWCAWNTNYIITSASANGGEHIVIRDTVAKQYQDIIQRLTRIETKIEK